MAHNLSKVQKKITKKKGRTTSLHENSRDAQKLRRASARSDRLGKLSAARSKANGPLLQRISFFQGAARATTEPISIEQTHTLIQKYLQRDAPLLASLQASRRIGRPSSTKEDLLRQRMEAEENEYRAGYWLPDMQDAGNVKKLKEWSGEWENLNTVPFVRVVRDGGSKGSCWPPKGES